MFELTLNSCFIFEAPVGLGKHKSLEDCAKAVRGYLIKKGWDDNDIQILPWKDIYFGRRYQAVLSGRYEYALARKVNE